MILIYFDVVFSWFPWLFTVPRGVVRTCPVIRLSPESLLLIKAGINKGKSGVTIKIVEIYQRDTGESD